MNDNEKLEHEELKKIVETLYHDIDIPEPSNWESVHLSLQKMNRRKKWMNRIKISGAIVAVSMILSVALSGNVSLIYAQFSTFLFNAKNEVVEFFFDRLEDQAATTEGAKTIPPEQAATELQGSASEITTLEIATNKLQFAPVLPAYMPGPFKLDRVRIFREAGGSYSTIHLEYVDNADNVILLTEQLVSEQASRIKTDVHEEAGVVKELFINKEQALLVELPDGFTSIEWLTVERIKIALSGQIPSAEILKIANSLQ